MGVFSLRLDEEFYAAMHEEIENVLMLRLVVMVRRFVGNRGEIHIVPPGRGPSMGVRSQRSRPLMRTSRWAILVFSLRETVRRRE